MNQESLSYAGPPEAVSSPLLYWISLLFITLGIAGMAVFFEADKLTQGIPFEQLLSHKLISYANLLLIGSGLLYPAHLRFTAEAVGKWATGLATAGAIGVSAALMTRWFETYHVLQEGHAPISNLYEVTALFSAITVAIYLAMESVYRTRSAGAFIMPIVVSAVLFDIWLAANGQANPSNLMPALKSYWMHAHVLANFIGYGAFAVAAGAGAMYLQRARAEKRGRPDAFALRALPGLRQIDDLIFKAIAAGFPVFTLATILGAAWAYDAWGGYWSWDPKETWSLIVWLTYATYFHLRYVKGWERTRMAWWAILGFGVTLFCFLGVNLFLSGLHSYGQLG
ncbi:MAG: c-type cytochrome biogenesis protein CcsB [Hydrogenophilales bacterium]|nr:c-type cytochrome biogenesis protein CcsB [Hydrogenophilales bacterium]